MLGSGLAGSDACLATRGGLPVPAEQIVFDDHGRAVLHAEIDVILGYDGSHVERIKAYIRQDVDYWRTGRLFVEGYVGRPHVNFY